MTTKMMAKVKAPGVFILRDKDADNVVLITPEGEDDVGVGHPDRSRSKQRLFKVISQINLG